MRNDRVASPFLAGLGSLLALSLAVAASEACSLLVETGADQCQGDGDCARFRGAACDRALHVCVLDGGAGGGGGARKGGPPPEAGAGGDGCGADSGCYACAPATPAQFLNACTAARCLPFDNRTRLTRLAADGGLPPIP